MARKQESSPAAQRAAKLDVRKIKGKISNVRKCQTCDGGKKKVENCPCGGSGKFNIANV
jgi:hypothetical protein